MDLLIGGDFSEQDKIDGMTPYQDMAFIGIAFCEAMPDAENKSM